MREQSRDTGTSQDDTARVATHCVTLESGNSQPLGPVTIRKVGTDSPPGAGASR